MLKLRDIADLNRTELEEHCKLHIRPVYLGDHTSLCHVLGRYKMFIDTTDRGFGCNVLVDGFWEMWLTQFIARFVKPGMQVADIGANFGYYSLLLADLVGSEGKLHCVEPNPAAAAMLRTSLRQNGFDDRASVHELAVGASNGQATICVPRGEPKNAHLLPLGATSTAGPMHVISLRRLDALLADETQLDFVKIDVESAEEEVIDGMEGLIRKFHPAIVLEFNPDRHKDPAGFLAQLREFYGCVRQIDYNSDLQPVDVERICSKNVDSLLFLNRDQVR